MPTEVIIGGKRYQLSYLNGALSAFLPGLGQFVTGHVRRGLILIFLFLGFGLFTIEFWDKILVLFQSGRLDGWIADLCLFLIIFGLWAGAVLDALFIRVRGAEEGKSQWTISWEHFKKNRMAMVGLVCVLFFYVVAILAPILAMYDPNIQNDVVATRYLAPSSDHFLGTDKFGRDIFSRVVYGARISLSVGFVAIFISVFIGTSIGAIAGYFGGLIDSILMRFVDMLLAFPRLFLILALIAVYSNSLFLTMMVLGLTGWMGTARIVRGQVLAQKEEDFVMAARALGMGDGRIIFRHVLPNVLAPVIVVATLGIGNVILAESFLSYLGLSVQPPTATWGSIINDGQDNLLGAWWISTFPGIAIVLTVLGYNLMGDGLRDALDPKLRD